MLLAIDIGNTNIVLGLYDLGVGGADPMAGLRAHWRVETRSSRTGDEYAALLSPLFSLAAVGFGDVTAVIVSSVVPPALSPIERLCRDHLRREPLVVGPGIKTGIPILYDNPREVGRRSHRQRRRRARPLAPRRHRRRFRHRDDLRRGHAAGRIRGRNHRARIDGVGGRALQPTAKLPRVEITRPRTAIGKNTVASIQSGLVFGYAGLVDALVGRIRAEIDFAPRIVGTGGLAPLVAAESSTIEECDDMLTLNGLRLLYDRNL